MRVEPPLEGAELPGLLGWLDFHRETLRQKASGLGADDLARTLVGSLSLGGLVKHLAYVEDWWFTCVWAGEPIPAPWQGVDWKADPDWDLTSGATDGPTVLDVHAEALQRSRQVVGTGDVDLDVVCPSPSRRDARTGFSRRWILVHMIEEYARHNGHADLIRESVDGVVGE